MNSYTDIQHKFDIYFQIFTLLIYNFIERDNKWPLYRTIDLVWSYPSFTLGLTDSFKLISPGADENC